VLRYLIDEHLLNLVTRLRRSAPELVVVGIGDPGAPPRGTADPDVLIWCEEHGMVLVSADVRTMRQHFENHLAAGRSSPGVMLVNAGLSETLAIDLLILAAAVLDSSELHGQLRFLGSL
jgi:hypothetical protein